MGFVNRDVIEVGDQKTVTFLSVGFTERRSGVQTGAAFHFSVKPHPAPSIDGLEDSSLSTTALPPHPTAGRRPSFPPEFLTAPAVSVWSGLQVSGTSYRRSAPAWQSCVPTTRALDVIDPASALPRSCGRCIPAK